MHAWINLMWYLSVIYYELIFIQIPIYLRIPFVRYNTKMFLIIIQPIVLTPNLSSIPLVVGNWTPIIKAENNTGITLSRHNHKI